MDMGFLNKLYERTREFEMWEREGKYDSFDEAESSFFEIVDEAKSRGMNPIGFGGERDVYTGGGVAGQNNVVKIARAGISQNSHAIQTWESIPEGAKQYIAPLIEWSSGHEWIVQARADGRGNIKEVSKNLSRYDLSVSDLNGTNVGVYQGKSVLIDLGQLY